jgi:hypothetical protein
VLLTVGADEEVSLTETERILLHIDSLHFLWCLICGSNH